MHLPLPDVCFDLKFKNTPLVILNAALAAALQDGAVYLACYPDRWAAVIAWLKEHALALARSRYCMQLGIRHQLPDRRHEVIVSSSGRAMLG